MFIYMNKLFVTLQNKWEEYLLEIVAIILRILGPLPLTIGTKGGRNGFLNSIHTLK